MKVNKVWAGLACLLALAALVRLSGAPVGAAQGEAETLAALRQQFQVELTGLRAEMLQQGVEFQEWKIRQLERELRRVEADDRGLEESEQSVLRQLAEVEQSIAQSAAAGAGQSAEPRGEPSAGGEARALGEQEGARAELGGTHLRGVRAKRQPLAEQAAEIRAQIRDEEQRLQELRRKLQQLKAEGATAPGR
jgi:chromosome segregation ATPase